MADPALDRIQRFLVEIYGAVKGRQAWARIAPLIEVARKRDWRDNVSRPFSAADVVLITYADSLLAPDQAPLETLSRFAVEYLRDRFSDIHILPFYPYSSDDGFSVMDFRQVDSRFGDWEHVQVLGARFGLMFDLVLNHVSAQSEWFQSYLAGTPGFEALAIEIKSHTDLSRVVRPRALPLLTPFTKKDGRAVQVWTTFSADQIDLNYQNLDVLTKMIDVLLLYVGQGARVIRLDAVAFLWKEIGTDCLHRPQTHAFVKMLRAILDYVAPHVLLVTETNVPHAENISYFGEGTDEAQMVYNFSLPPLLLHTFYSADATILSRWAQSLSPPSPRTTFFNFCASHDGIGVRPLEGLVDDGVLAGVVDRVLSNGGQVSSKSNPDGSQSPYELNITYVDALKSIGDVRDPLHAQRFLASQAIQYALPGVPATYIHSLLGSQNWQAGVQASGIPRRINRQKLAYPELLSVLHNPASLRHQIFWPYLEMIGIRVGQPAFSPDAGCRILDMGPRVFALERRHAMQTLYAVTNVGETERHVALSDLPPVTRLVDLFSGQLVSAARIPLAPYQYRWLLES